MRFKRPSVRYSDTPAPVTPYQAAQQAWDERIGSARVQAYNWRVMAFGSLALLFIMAAGLLWQSTRSTLVPYIVEVDREGGARAVGPAREAQRPGDGQIGHHLSTFIHNVRSLSIDPIVLRDNWNSAYHYVTPRGAALLNEYARANDPFIRVGRESVAIQITSVVRASQTSFQLRWIERTYTNGVLTATARWTAMLSFVLQPPTTQELIHKNPLGIYVDGLDWSKELDTGRNSGDPQ